MTQDEANTEELGRIHRAVNKGDINAIAGSIAVSLLRIAAAQEAMHELAVTDMTAAIEEAIQSRSQDLADQIVADKTKRSFLGKKT